MNVPNVLNLDPTLQSEVAPEIPSWSSQISIFSDLPIWQNLSFIYYKLEKSNALIQLHLIFHSARMYP